MPRQILPIFFFLLCIIGGDLRGSKFPARPVNFFAVHGPARLNFTKHALQLKLVIKIRTHIYA